MTIFVGRQIFKISVEGERVEVTDPTGKLSHTWDIGGLGPLADWIGEGKVAYVEAEIIDGLLVIHKRIG